MRSVQGGTLSPLMWVLGSLKEIQLTFFCGNQIHYSICHAPSSIASQLDVTDPNILKRKKLVSMNAYLYWK